MQVFPWLMVQNKILTIDNLMKKGWAMVNRCVMCKAEIETVSHLFKKCRTSIAIYNQVTTTMGLTMPIRDARKALTSQSLTGDEKSVLLITQFVVCRERCSRVFTDKSNNTENLLQQIQDQWRITKMAHQTH